MAPAWGHVLFKGQMHPTTLLISWLAAVAGIQFFGYPLIFCGVLCILVFAQGAVIAWYAYIFRARWLLLALWLVLAYGVAGEALFDQDWMPTREGVEVANLQAMRLVLILGFLAWLFNLLGRTGLTVGLWGMLQPLRQRGHDTDRLVIRLSLVLENLNSPTTKESWRHMLDCEQPLVGSETLKLILPTWRFTDTLFVIFVMIILAVCVVI